MAYLDSKTSPHIRSFSSNEQKWVISGQSKSVLDGSNPPCMGRNNRILRIQILSIQKKNLSKKIKTSEYFLFGPVKKADQKPHGP
jgi:hypothetical protein